MRNKGTLTNIDNSDLVNYPNGRVKNNDGSGNGTPVNEIVKGDLHEFFDKALRLYGYVHNNLPDNETNGYQTIDAVIALASKNDFVLDLTTNAGVLNVALKLGKLLNNESFIFKATIDKTTETQLKGTIDNVTKTVSFIGDFKAGEYVRAINTASNVVLVRLADAVNIDTIVSENGFLKKASQVEEDAGVVDTVGTTPLVNKTTFIKRVNDNTESLPYLASASNNGVYPKEHFIIVDGLASLVERNYGTITGFDAGGGVIGGSLVTTGDITSCIIDEVVGGQTVVTCTMDNAMDDLNYEVITSIQSVSPDIKTDNDIGSIVFRPISNTTFKISIEEFDAATQNLKIHFSVKQR